MRDFVDSYSRGEFSKIECPIIFQDNEDFYKSISDSGYQRVSGLGDPDDPTLEVYALRNLEADCDYPYFVLCDFLLEERLVFMPHWFEVSEFLNRYSAPYLTHVIEDILSSLNNIYDILDKKTDRPY